MHTIKKSALVYSGANCGVVRLQLFPAAVQEEKKRKLINSNQQALTEELVGEMTVLKHSS